MYVGSQRMELPEEAWGTRVPQRSVTGLRGHCVHQRESAGVLTRLAD